MEWGGPASQHTIVDWTEIGSEAEALAFGDALLSAPRAAVGYNSISEAIAYSADLIATNAYEGVRKVIDVSGDGPQIGGRLLLDLIRDQTVSEGITINALVVETVRTIAARRASPWTTIIALMSSVVSVPLWSWRMRHAASAIRCSVK